jgi:hypothetical protein
MEVTLTIRGWLLGACCTLLLLAIGWAGFVDDRSLSHCLACDGTGMVWGGKSGSYISCDRCDGPGTRYSAEAHRTQLLLRVLNLRRWVCNWVSDDPWRFLPAGACIVILGISLALTRMVDCRHCRASGVLPVSRRTFVQETCVDCGGRGRLTFIDRWVAGS